VRAVCARASSLGEQRLATRHLATHRTELVAPISPPVRGYVAPKKSHWQGRLLGVATFLVVPGFVLATSLPALSIGTNPADAAAAAVTHDTVKTADLQTVSVSQAAELNADRTAFTADTHAQVLARRAIQARAGAYSVVGPRQAGDDYPWRSSGGGLSPLGYVTRQCTDFVAWRLNRDAGSTSAPFRFVWSNLTPSGGSASRWAANWNAHGWNTSHTPVTGSVAWFNGNHVAYVKQVNGDGSVDLEEYNWNGSASYHTRTIAASSVALFLYPPP
jgi:peptidoglycan DL-endopeptidase CwlO